MLKQFAKVRCITDHPHPTASPDYLVPAGSIEDNHTNPQFIWEIDTFFEGQPYKLLDIGCAGGQFAVDINHKGFPWLGVGLEGGNIYGMTTEFDARECETGTITLARGAENWERHKDKCLFHADVSKDFALLDENEDIIKFDIVTAWEFFEHPAPEEIPLIIRNIKKHLKPGGIIVGTINLSPGFHHRCAKPTVWWDKMFMSHGFGVYEYPFNSSPRAGTLLRTIREIKDQHREEFAKQGIDVDEAELSYKEETIMPSEYNYPACFALLESGD